MTYKGIKHIMDGLYEADCEIFFKIDIVYALSNIDEIDVADDNIDEVCAILYDRYLAYLSTKGAKADACDFAYAVNEAIRDMDEEKTDAIATLDKVDWDAVYAIANELD